MKGGAKPVLFLHPRAFARILKVEHGWRYIALLCNLLGFIGSEDRDGPENLHTTPRTIAY